ncbi:MAG: S4 domain-containing protein [Eubacteriales bacterium]|nr:S4 domain-containing protein [Eubacteriales bacterium]
MKKTSKKGSGKKMSAVAASAAFDAASESSAASAGSAASPADSAASAGTAASTGSAASDAASAVSEVSAVAPAGPQRLDKLLGQEGLGTRSELKKAVRKGRVTVNGAVEKDPGRQITAEDRVCFDGKEVRRDQYVYYMLNKPAGVITATEDGRMRTVLDLLREPVQVPEEAEPGPAAADFP